MDHMKEIYESLFFEGTPIGFATEKIINTQNNFSMKAIVVFNTKYVTKGELRALQKFLDNGGTIIKDNISLTHTEYNKRHTTLLRGSNGVIINAQGKAAMKREAFRVLANKNSLPAIVINETKNSGPKTCAAKSYSKNGKNVISIVNIGKTSSQISLKFNGSNNLRITNMINGKSINNGFTMKREEVLLLKVESGGSSGGSTGGSFVHIRKRNAAGFALDGGNGGANGQNVKLWEAYEGNENQQWQEISRGNGFYSYKKRNTNFCLDGGNGGANAQSAKLWSCNNTNQNQHWKKISTGGGHFRLEKRNATSFSLDGGNGGANGQNVKLWRDDIPNQNREWRFTTINTSASATISKELIEEKVLEEETNEASVFPNPFISNATLFLKDKHSYNAISLYDVGGKLLFSKSINDSEAVSHPN